MRTVEQWLNQKDLPTELGRVFTPKAKHDWLEPAIYYGPSDPLGFVVKCQKCGHVKTLQEEIDGCSVPDPITIDQNTAKYWQSKCNKAIFADSLLDIYRQTCTADSTDTGGFYVIYKYTTWLRELAQPKHYLIAAVMAMERKEE